MASTAAETAPAANGESGPSLDPAPATEEKEQSAAAPQDVMSVISRLAAKGVPSVLEAMRERSADSEYQCWCCDALSGLCAGNGASITIDAARSLHYCVLVTAWPRYPAILSHLHVHACDISRLLPPPLFLTLPLSSSLSIVSPLSSPLLCAPCVCCRDGPQAGGRGRRPEPGA